MRRALLCGLLLMLAACSPTERLNTLGETFEIDPAIPPDAEQLMQVLLENQSLPVRGTHCASGTDDKRLLLHRLVMTFGVLAAPPPDIARRVRPAVHRLVAACKVEPGFVGWRCSLTTSVGDAAVMSVSTIEVSLDKKTWAAYPESLRCE